MMPLRDMRGEIEAMALYCGQSAGLVYDSLPAGEIVARMAQQALSTVQRLSHPEPS